MLKQLIVMLLVLLSISGAVMAEAGFDDEGNPNNPAVNERANACYEGGSLEGKCDTQEEWDAGWYLIRYQVNMISRENFPIQYIWILPPVVEIVAAPGVPPIPPLNVAAGCYDGAGGNFDRLYNGTPNVVGNVQGFTTINGTCGGPNQWAGIDVVWAMTNETDPTLVLAYCNTLGGTFSQVYHEIDMGFPVPSYVWLCLV
jgi:hypothetical protein